MQKIENRFSLMGGLFLIAGLTLSNAIAETDLSSQLTNSKTFVYTVKINGIGAGKVHTQITQDEQNFHIESVTKPNRLAGMLLGGNVVDRCAFSFNTQEHVVGNHYSSTKKGKSSYGGQILYNWDQQQLEFSQITVNEPKKTPMPTGFLLDNCNFYAAMALADIDYLKQREIIVLDAKEQRFRGYRFESLQHEVLDTRFGRLDTRKLTLVRSNNSNRHLIFWLSDQYWLAPVMIVDQRKRRKVVAKLRSVIN